MADKEKIEETEINETEEKTKDEDKDQGEGADGSSGKEDPTSLANRKFAEGSKKATKELLKKYGVNTVEELDAKINNGVSKDEFETLQAKVICGDLDVKKEFRDDVIAIVKGSGLPITQENVQAVLARHPEWKMASESADNPIQKIGDTGGKDKPEQPNERELARKLFN